MTINKFKSAGEWRDVRGSLLAVLELTAPRITTTSSALGFLSREQIAYDLESLKAMQENAFMSANDIALVQQAIESYPA